MAGHSKFKNIMHRKGSQDKKRAKIFNVNNLNSNGDIVILFPNIVINFYSENLYPPP